MNKIKNIWQKKNQKEKNMLFERHLRKIMLFEKYAFWKTLKKN